MIPASSVTVFPVWQPDFAQVRLLSPGEPDAPAGAPPGFDQVVVTDEITTIETSSNVNIAKINFLIGC